MMRVPPFRYVAPRTVDEAAKALRDAGPEGMLLAGGTDLLPNMKRRQQTPKVVIGLRGVQELKACLANQDGSITLGAGLTLAGTVKSPYARQDAYRALTTAAGKVATTHIQNMGTLGGNLCLDTRCNYYDQNYEWRKAIDFCKKAPDGEAQREVTHGTCWVAPGSPRCWAVSSTDCAPALVALGAQVTLVSADGRRTIPVLSLYKNDGMDYLAGKRRDEVLTQVHVPAMAGWRSTYWKLRRRGSFDFPVLSVAAALKLGKGGVVESARVALGAVASCPLEVSTESLIGKPLTDDALEAFADLAARPARPLDNTDYHLSWRKRVTREYVLGALKELRGDAPSLLQRTAARVLPVVSA
jgi:4-hydroxybenzoyl-CoA reductase subunit beta